MGQKSKQRILNKRISNGREMIKEMLNIFRHQGNKIQNDSEIPPYTCQNG